MAGGTNLSNLLEFLQQLINRMGIFPRHPILESESR